MFAGDGGGPRGGGDAHVGEGRGGGALDDVELEPKSIGRHVTGPRGDGLG